MVQHRAKQSAVLLVVSLGDEGAPQVDAHPPESQHQPQAVLLVLLHREAPVQPNTSA